MKSSFFHINLEKEITILSAYLTIYFMYWGFGEYSFLLSDVSNLYISQATLDGVDISKRVGFFYKMVMTAFVVLPLLYFLVYKLKTFFQVKIEDLQLATVMATTGIFLILSNILGIENQQSNSLVFFLFIITILPLGFNKKKHLSFYPQALTIALLLFSTSLFLFNSNLFLIQNSVSLFLAIFLMVLFGVQGIMSYSKVSARKLFTSLLPLSLLPIFIFISIESVFFFKIRYDIFIPYKWLFISFSGAAFAFSSVYFLKKKTSISSFKLFSHFFVPAALLSFLLLVLYHPFLEQSQELFELANPANAQMRFFAFGEIPFVDFMPSHMISEQFYGSIHHLIFGYEGTLDFLTYRFFYQIIFFGIAYYFLFRLFKNPFLPLLFIIFIPFSNRFFYTSLLYGIPVFFAIRTLMRAQKVSHYLGLFSLIIFLITWQLDTGSAVLFTTMVFLPISFYVAKQKIDFRTLFISLFIVLSGITALVVLFSVIRSPAYLLTNFKTALHYVTANQAHGYSLLSKTPNQHFFLFYLILPTISVFAILYSIYFLRKYKSTISKGVQFSFHASLFLYLLYIANFQRGLVRHHFIEHNDSFVTGTFYIATALFLLGFLKVKRPTEKYIAFFALSFLLLVFVKYFSIDQSKSTTEKLLTKNTLINLDDYFNVKNFKGKIIPNEEFAAQNYSDFKRFLDKNLSAEQTFLDFSNTPMLYYYCQREVPSYFCQNLQNTVDEYLQLQHLAALNPEKVPVVVYSGYPLSWWDKTDGVPSAMRQYLIAEYIYKYYTPFSIINNRSIWIAKDKRMLWGNKQIDTLVQKPQVYNYKKAGLAINSYYANKKSKTLELLGEGVMVADSSKMFSFFEVKREIANSSSVLLKIFIENPRHGQINNIELSDRDNEMIGSILFTTLGNQKEYMVHVSNHYLWHTKTVKYLKVINTGGIDIQKVEFYKDIINEHE